MKQANQILSLLFIMIALTFTGCEQSEPESIHYDPVPIPIREKYTSISDGPRPKAIDGATIIDTHQFHEKEFRDGERVCIEGIVNRSGSLMGSEYVSVTCLVCETKIHCEGFPLEKFEIANGTRVLIRGRVFGGNMLDESMPISQDEIDITLDSESKPEPLELPASAASSKAK